MQGDRRVALLRCSDGGDGTSIVEAEVTSSAGEAIVRGPYRFATAHEAFSFVQEATLALVNTLAPSSRRDEARASFEREHREWSERNEPRSHSGRSSATSRDAASAAREPELSRARSWTSSAAPYSPSPRRRRRRLLLPLPSWKR